MPRRAEPWRAAAWHAVAWLAWSGAGPHVAPSVLITSRCEWCRRTAGWSTASGAAGPSASPTRTTGATPALGTLATSTPTSLVHGHHSSAVQDYLAASQFGLLAPAYLLQLQVACRSTTPPSGATGGSLRVCGSPLGTLPSPRTLQVHQPDGACVAAKFAWPAKPKAGSAAVVPPTLHCASRNRQAHGLLQTARQQDPRRHRPEERAIEQVRRHGRPGRVQPLPLQLQPRVDGRARLHREMALDALEGTHTHTHTHTHRSMDSVSGPLLSCL